MSTPDNGQPATTAAAEAQAADVAKPEARPARAHATPHGNAAGQPWLNPALILALVALLAAVGLFWLNHERMQSLELQLARRIGEFDSASREARSAAQDANALLNDLTARLAAQEARAQEAQSQQLSLAAMYQELAHSQDERIVADIEQTLLLAQQQLQLAGNVRAALIALEAAEARLARLNKPHLANLQQAIAKDVARLKLMPAADPAGISAKLDVLVQSVERLRLVSDPGPRTARPSAAETGGQRWDSLANDLWGELKQLVSIRRLDQPAVALLAPDQAWFLRENLKLRLLAARLAMLNRDEAAFRQDLAAVQEWLGRYFDRQDPHTQTLQASLKELAKLPVSTQEVSLEESLKALRTIGGIAAGRQE